MVSVHRTGLTLHDGRCERDVPVAGRWFKPGSDQRPTVGDWVVLDEAGASIEQLVDRRNLLRRRQADGAAPQPMAANIDALFIVTACNSEFNPSRLERYLLLAGDAGVVPVVVLTKIDETPEPGTYVSAAQAVAGDAPVHAVDARDPASVAVLRSWCGAGRTLVLVGSSGVGKSTLLNSLAGAERQKTGAARSADNRGRHTTSHRSLHALPDGTLVIDSPGIRELGLLDGDVDPAVAFADIDLLAETCRFRDCRHDREPGCAVRSAVDDGRIDPRRIASYHKLVAERGVQKVVQRSLQLPRSGMKRKGKLPRRPDTDPQPS